MEIVFLTGFRQLEHDSATKLTRTEPLDESNAPAPMRPPRQSKPAQGNFNAAII
jgi:hypothetical protein